MSWAGRISALAIVALALVACQSPRERYEEACAELGFTADTAEMRTCVLEHEKMMFRLATQG